MCLIDVLETLEIYLDKISIRFLLKKLKNHIKCRSNKNIARQYLNRNIMATFKELINSDKPVLIDFYADWCGPCKMMAPILEDLKSKVGDSSTIVKIDVDKNQAIASSLNVRSIPTLMIFQNGELKWTEKGVVSAKRLEETLKSFSVTA